MKYQDAVNRAEKASSECYQCPMKMTFVMAKESGWFFQLNTLKYLETGSSNFMIGDGIYSYFVSKTGVVWFIPSAFHHFTFFKEYEKHLAGVESEIINKIIARNSK